LHAADSRSSGFDGTIQAIMDNAFEAAPDPASAQPANIRKVGQLAARTTLYAALALTVAAMAYAGYHASLETSAMRSSQARLVANHGLVEPGRKRLSPDYVDGDHDLVADPPADVAKCIDPEVLVVAHYVGDESDAEPIDWEAFRAGLSAATGKQVSLREYNNSAADVADLKSAAIHVVALHSADAPYAVNNAGFVPVAVLGTESGANGNHLVIAAGPRNKIRTLSDLRGHKLTCTRPDSITGYRAAIAVLSQEAGMRPDVDYSINFSHGQKRSLGGLLAGNFEVAALSDDKIQQLVKAEELKPADLRVIYESQVIPRLTLGHAHQLDDPLADKIKSATLAFENQQGPVDELSGKPLRFMPADYRKDFEFVRRIDDCFDPRLHKWSKEKSSPAMSAPADSDPIP
jgi:phosphonate transport system substrate-binding protein